MEGMEEVVDVKRGLKILMIAIVLSILLFRIVNSADLNLQNFMTVFAGIFGILIVFYFLYKLRD